MIPNVEQRRYGDRGWDRMSATEQEKFRREIRRENGVRSVLIQTREWFAKFTEKQAKEQARITRDRHA